MPNTESRIALKQNSVFFSVIVLTFPGRRGRTNVFYGNFSSRDDDKIS